MKASSGEGQLEFFDVAHQSAPRPYRETIGRVLLQVRYDQLVLISIAGLMGVTVIFACGVERGKQLVRSERVILARQQLHVPQTPATTSADRPTEGASPSSARQPESGGGEKEKTDAPAPSKVQKKIPTRLATGKSRYVIQVVTYSRSQLAKQELERLKARGERAFLILREGHTAVYVGPFPSKINASEKLAMLKTQYQDCFLKTL